METLFPGLAAMRNLHPLIVHFPVAMLVLAFVFQAVVVLGKREGLQGFASGLLYLGALAALPTVLTGLLGEGNLEKSVTLAPAIDTALEFHCTVMYVVTGLAVALAVLAFWKRTRMTRGTATVLLVGLLVLVGLIGVGADRGGQLVYQYGLGGQKMGAQLPQRPGP